MEERGRLMAVSDYSQASRANSPRRSIQPTEATTPSTSQSPMRNGGMDSRLLDKAKVSVPGWMPFTMKAPFLCAMIILSLALAGVIEFLAQTSQRDGGLALSQSEDDIPNSVNIAYLYVPTTIAVLYSLLWTCIDVDVRRMQPWLELSRPNGATGEQSLLLDYPFEFLPFIPITAWKRGHWPVFILGLIMMSIFWTITPLQGAIFGKQSVALSKSVPMSTSLGLVPVEEQAFLLDSSILNAAYVSMWFSQEVPEYTTNEYALLPFSPPDSTTLGTNETWKVNTTKFATDLDCWPATYSWNATSQGGVFLFDNGRGCTYDSSFGINGADWAAQYMGYYPNDYLDWTPIDSDTCGPEFSHQVFIFMGQGTGDPSNDTFSNITALFCEASYTQQDVSIVVDATTRQPLQDSLIELGPATNLSESLFNSTAFEFLLYGGFPLLSANRDYPDDLVLQPEATVYGLNISFPISNMVGLFFGFYDNPMSDLLNATIIQETYATVHKLVFTFAISQLASQSADWKTRDGLIGYTLYGIVVSRPFSIAVEIMLAVVAILGAILLCTIIWSKSNLEGDPDSTASLLRMIRYEGEVLTHFSCKDGMDEGSLRNSIASDRYSLQKDNVAGHSTLHLLSHGDTAESSDGDTGGNTRSNAQVTYIRPKEMRPMMGILLVLVLAAAIGVLSYLKHQELLLYGLTRPTQNFEVLQLLENYIPMVYSTLLEPFITLLNRLISVLQPYFDLQMGKRPARTTIETNYDSLPPQLNILRAAKAGHYFLSLLSIVVLLVNVLSIALGAIFNESPISVNTALNVTSLKTSALTRDVVMPPSTEDFSSTWFYFDHFYMVQSNMSGGAQLPPWIDEKFAYLPFADLISTDNSSATYTAITRGFGMAANCSELPTSNTSINYVAYNFNSTVTYAEISEQEQTLEVTYGNTSYKCGLGEFGTSLQFPTGGNSTEAQELYSWLSPTSEVNGTGNLCETTVLLGWMRYNQGQSAGSQPNSTWMQCKSEFLTGQFNVTVDADGYILGSERIGPYEDVADSLDTNMVNVTSLWQNLNMYIGGFGQGDASSAGEDLSWHNDTLTRNWMSYFLKIATNSTDLVDPNKPLPDVTSIAPTVEMIYQRIGAALLGARLDIFADSGQQTATLRAVMVTSDTRIFMDNTAYIISISILGVYALVFSLFYLRQRSTLLPRMPSSIGSTIAYVAASRAVRMYDGPARDRNTPGGTYSFGKYTGLDGKVHVGVEIDPYVVPSRPRSSWWTWSSSQGKYRQQGGGKNNAARALMNKLR